MLKINHLGEDYSTIEVNGLEFEAPLALGLEILKEQKAQAKELKTLKKNLSIILDYLSDEKKDYEEWGKQKGHIFEIMSEVESWMKVNE
jgi:hypothetical protein